MQTRFESFIREQKYVANVSPRTLEWYDQSFAWLKTETPTAEQLTDCVVRMRDVGLRASTVNNRLRCINAYLHWPFLGRPSAEQVVNICVSRSSEKRGGY